MTPEETITIYSRYSFILLIILKMSLKSEKSKLEENKMKYGICRLAAAVTLMLTTAIISFAQSSQQDWSSVKNLTPGTKVIVATKNRETVKGSITNATDSALNLSNDGNSITLNQGEISEIYLAKKSSLIKRAFLGAGIGAAVGFGIGGIYSLATQGDGLAAAGGLIYGLPIGAAVGAATGGKTRKGKLIYKSN